MVLLQAIWTLLSRSLSGVLTAVFGWAVVALFGHTGEREKTLLSALVGAAAIWPLLVVGVVFPHVAGMVLAFLPLTKEIPSLALRVVWLVLAVAVPITLGLVFAARAPKRARQVPFWKRLLWGFPLTLGLALAFAMMFLIAPVLQLVSIARKRRDRHVPLLSESGVYDEVARVIEHALVAAGLKVRPRPPPLWLTAPTALLRAFGGHAVEGYAPSHLFYLQGPELTLALYPSEVLLRGAPAVLARLQGILSEALLTTGALETTEPAAQRIERRIKLIVGSRTTRARGMDATTVSSRALLEAVRDIDRTQLTEDDWRILYREALQVARALEDKPQLLAAYEEDGRTGRSQTAPGIDDRRGLRRHIPQ